MDWYPEMNFNDAAYRSRMVAVWEKKSIFRVPYAESIGMGLLDADARILDQLGFPSWAAPNIWLHPPIARLNGLVCIGEDSEDREIQYATDSGGVFVSCESGRLFIAPSLLDFLVLLIGFAELIEKGIAACGSNAYVDRKIPAHLVAEFCETVKAQLGKESAEASIWIDESMKLARNSR